MTLPMLPDRTLHACTASHQLSGVGIHCVRHTEPSLEIEKAFMQYRQQHSAGQGAVIPCQGRRVSGRCGMAASPL